MIKINNKIRSKKLNPRIDLTAMINICYLLIIFYMVSIELTKPKTIELGLPENSCSPDTGIIRCGGFQERVITLLLDDNNKIISYSGSLGYSETMPKVLGYGIEGIRKELLRNSDRINAYYSTNYNKNRGAIVIIKPSKNGSYKIIGEKL